MKDLMIGNKAVARGLYEAGCTVISSYPGTPSTEITEFAAEYREMHCEWAPNEKVALEVAFGASLAGARSACAMKHVGMNVAADPLFTLSYTGVNGGLVICVADDPGMHSSQNEQDSRHYAVSAKIPMLEPADSEECKEFAKAAFELSEKFDTPVMLRLCTRIAHAQSLVDLCEREERENIKYEKNGAKYIMMPGNAKRRHPIVEQRTLDIAEFAETSTLNRIEGEGEVGIITSGTCYQYAKEVFGDTVKILKLGMVNPLPTQIIKDFAASVKKLYVIEELDPVIENHLSAIGVQIDGGKDMFSPIGEFSQEIVAKAFGVAAEKKAAELGDIPMRPPVMCAGCPHRGVFFTLAKNKVTVLGDIGCYTLGAQAPLSAIDSTLCMGASVSGLHGFNLAGGKAAEEKSVAVIGDSTFLHSGVTGLMNIAYNATNSTVIILDNSITGMTGHQQNPATGYNLRGEPASKIDLEGLCRAVGINRVRVVDPYDLKACDKAIKEELAVEEPSVIISRRPCVLLKSVKAKPSLIISEKDCRGCRACMKLGCPAISFKNGKATIDATLCVGCGVCKQLCAFNAICDGEER